MFLAMKDKLDGTDVVIVFCALAGGVSLPYVVKMLTGDKK